MAEGSPGLLVVLSGPSGVGKDAVLARMRALGRPFHFTVTATTRRRRPTERDGADYLFLSEADFRQQVAAGEFLEWAEVYGNLYGVPKQQVRDALALGRDVLLKVDAQGAATIRRIAPGGVFVFLAPPSLDALARRLRGRMTEPDDALGARLSVAESEMVEASRFDYVVINHQCRLDEAVDEIERIVATERARPDRARVAL